MKAIGYIRQSRRADLDVALSPDQQRSDILKLAERDGLNANDVTIYSDLGRSGGAGKERHRSGYKAVVAALEDGEARVLYAKALTRLARSVTELYRILDIARGQGVKIITAKEGVMDPATPIGKAQFGMLAVFAEFERDLAVERAQDNVATRRANGERMGRAPYGARPGEDPALIVRAFERTRSLNGAAHWLNGQMIPSPLGRLWSGTGVRGVLERHAPHLLPRRRTHGVKPSSPFLFYRLLRCACGRILTAGRDNRRPGQVVYRCHAASVEPEHHRPYRVRESEIMDWVKAEAARLRVPERVTIAEKDAVERAALLAERQRLALAFTKGMLDENVVLARHAEIDDEITKLDDVEAVIDVPAIDWSWPPEQLNRVLASLWEHVQLDEAMRPTVALWRVPAWRR